MPLKGEAKRLYQAAYMRRRRASLVLEGSGGKEGSNNRKTRAPYKRDVRPWGRRTGVSPFTGRLFQWWDEQAPLDLYPLNRRHLAPHMSYLAERGQMLQVIEVETGEILGIVGKGVRVVYRLVSLRPIYEQTPTTQVIRDAPVERIVAVERRLIQVEADLALHEAQETYREAEHGEQAHR